jgi:hypothetical protein
VPVLGVDRRVEVKVRARGFRQLYEWLTGADLLVARADRSEPLVIIPFRLAIEIARAAENSRASRESAPATDCPAPGALEVL